MRLIRVTFGIRKSVSKCFRSVCNEKFYSNSSMCVDLNEDKVKRFLENSRSEFSILQKEGQRNSRFTYLEPIVSCLNERDNLEKELISLKELLKEKDEELRKLATEENNQLLSKLDNVNSALMDSLIPPEEDQSRDLVLEITAGVGGKEAMLFASEILDMYHNYCLYKNWEWTSASSDTSDLGGIRHTSVFISGLSAYNSLIQESGVHRVQRIPATEKSGRLHTSTVSVAVLPQPTEIEVSLKDSELKIETKRASGAGGQHVNTTDSCVRITHLPTGLVVESQEERYQQRNKTLALTRLRSKLYQIQLDEQLKSASESRKYQVGLGMRSDKVRTYNFNQDRITDHRLGVTIHNLPAFLSGGAELNKIIEKLRFKNREDQLKNILNNMK